MAESEDTIELPQRRSFFERLSWRTILLAVGAVLALLVVIFVIWANQPTSSRPSVSTVQGVNEVVEKNKTLTSKYYSVSIPDSFNVKTKQEQDKGPIRSQTMLANANTQFETPLADQMGITVGDLPSDGLAGLSDVKFRTLTSSGYSAKTFEGSPPGAVVFSKGGSTYEIAAFWPHNGRYAAVAVSGTADRTATLDKLLRQALTSWQWR